VSRIPGVATVLATASVSNVSEIPFVVVVPVLAVVGFLAVASVSCCLRPYIPILSLMATLLLLASLDVPVYLVLLSSLLFL
jgi:hypothetical protein